MGIINGLCGHKRIKLHIIYAHDANAFTIPIQYGFAVFVTIPLIELLQYDPERIMAVVAHEMAHGLLFHHVRAEYAAAKIFITVLSPASTALPKRPMLTVQQSPAPKLPPKCMTA